MPNEGESPEKVQGSVAPLETRAQRMEKLEVIRDDADGKFTLIRWIRYETYTDDCHSPAKYVSAIGRESERPCPPNGVSKREVRKMSDRKKLIVLAIVIILAISPVLPSILLRSNEQRCDTVLGEGTPTSTVFLGGMVTIEKVETGAEAVYRFTHKDGSCNWSYFDNDLPAYNIAGSGLEKRDYVKLGTGSTIDVPVSKFHVGSYKIKLVTSNNVKAFNLIIDGDVSHTFKWPFMGEKGSSVMNTVRISYKYTDYYYYASDVDDIDSSPGRHEYSRIADFAVRDKSGVVDRLVSALGSEYLRNYYPPDSDWYINYILTFVQECFKYTEYHQQPDLFMYGYVDYFAYPLQTIYRAGGDCEDTAILAAALFDTAGYEAAVTLVYADSAGNRIVGHSTAAVNMQKVVSNVNLAVGDLVVCKMDGPKGTSKEKIEYYLCETTSAQQMAAGYIEKRYVQEIKSLGKNVNVLYPVTVNDKLAKIGDTTHP